MCETCVREFLSVDAFHSPCIRPLLWTPSNYYFFFNQRLWPVGSTQRDMMCFRTKSPRKPKIMSHVSHNLGLIRSIENPTMTIYHREEYNYSKCTLLAELVTLLSFSICVSLPSACKYVNGSSARLQRIAMRFWWELIMWNCIDDRLWRTLFPLYFDNDA